jgi:nitrite reductase/ring-hydroxylating ferredoxin subunit
MAFVSVARIADIPRDRGLCVEVDGIEVGLFRVGDAVYAMENRCPHAGFPLSEGELEGHVVVCKAHGWPFDVRTGFDPDDADGFPIPCFAVEVEDGDVRVDLECRTNAPPRRNAARDRSS